MKSFRARSVGAWLIAVAMWTPAAFPSELPPLSLRQAVDAALANNPELQGFAFQLSAQQARIRQAGLGPVPELSVDAENMLGSGASKGTETAEFTFALSQVLELGGKRSARVAAAEAALQTLDVDRQARQLDVLAEVTRRFINVASQQELLKLAREATDLARKTVDGSQLRVDAAKAPHVELDRARIAFDRARLDERRAEVELETARLQLASTWGSNTTAIGGQPFGDIAADLFSLPEVESFSTLVARVTANPDFIRFASEARLKEADLRLAATVRRPDVTVGAGVRRFQENGDNALVASFSIPLFGGGRAESFVAEAQANRDVVDTARRAAEIKAQASLFELHQQLAIAVREAQTLRADMLPRVQEALKETIYAFQRGRYSYLELVDAQREFLSVQTSLIEASSNAHTLQTEIERLTNAPLTSTPNKN